MSFAKATTSAAAFFLARFLQGGSFRIILSTFTALVILGLVLWIVQLHRRLEAHTSEPESLWRFHQVADNLPIVLALSNADLSRFLYVNCAYEQLWGRTVASVYANSRSFIEGVHPEDRAALQMALEELIQGKPIENHECRVVRPDGSTSWVLCRGFSIHDAQGKIVRLVGSAQDVTERKQGEEKLRESEDLYRDLVEHSQDLICTHDLQGILLSVNEAPLRILGYSRDELLYKPLRDFVTEDARRLCDDYLANIKEKGFARGLLPVVTKSGAVRLWEYSNSLRCEGVSAPIVRGIAHDVTEQKMAEAALRKSEEMFSKAFRSSPVEMAITTLHEGRFVDVNESFERNIGFSREEAIGRTSLELELWVDPVERAAMVEEIQRTGRVSNREIQIRARSGEIGFKLYSAELIRLGGQECLLAVSEDITARKRAEDELRKLTRQLLRLHDEERRRLARELHDTTGQNLVAVTALLSHIRDLVPRSNGRAAGLTSKCEELLTACIREVRTLSYALYPPLLEKAGLESAIRDYLTGFRERTDIRVELQVQPNLNRMSKETELALYRVVQESLLNIRRHSGSAKARITIARKPNSISLEVADYGRGIAGYKRGPNGELPSTMGVGVRSMIERVKQVGGRLEVDSSPAGTTILVYVPDDERGA